MQKIIATLALLGITAADAAPTGNQGLYTDQSLVTVHMTLSKSKVLRDTPVTVNWVSYDNSPGCLVSGLPGGDYWGAGAGSYTFTAQASTTITVTCTGEIRPISRSKSLYVAPDGTLPEVTASYSPSTISEEGSSTLSWSSYYAEGCSDGSQSLSSGGSQRRYFGTYGNFQSTITCSNRFGESSAAANITVLQRPPEASIYAVPAYLPAPGDVTVYTSSSRANFCDMLPWAHFYIASTTTFWVTCTNNVGSATARTTVQVGLGFAANQGIVAQDDKHDSQKAVQKEILKLSHLGIDLQQEGIEFVVLDLNQDKSQDVLVLDTQRAQLHVVLAEKGRFVKIHKTFDNVPSFAAFDTVYIEKDAVQTTHLLFKK